MFVIVYHIICPTKMSFVENDRQRRKSRVPQRFKDFDTGDVFHRQHEDSREYSAAVKLEPKDDENVSESHPEKSRLVANRDSARSSRHNVEAQSDPKIAKASQINNPSDINLDTSIKLEENELDLSLDFIPFFGSERNFKHENSNQIEDIGTFCSKSAQGSESNGSCTKKHKEKAFQAGLEPVLDDLEDPTASIEIHHCQGAISRIENKNEIIQDQNQDFSNFLGTYKSEKESAITVNRKSVSTSSKGRGRGHGTRSKIKGGRGRPRGPTLGSHGSKIRFEDSFRTPEFNSANIQLQTTPEVPDSDQQIPGTSRSFFGKRGGMRGRKRATSQNEITSDSLVDPSVRAKGRQRGNRGRKHAISQTELAGASLINPSVTCRGRGKRNRNTCVSQNEIVDNNCSQSRKRQRKETKSLLENASDNELDTMCKGSKKRRLGKKKQHNESDCDQKEEETRKDKLQTKSNSRGRQRGRPKNLSRQERGHTNCAQKTCYLLPFNCGLAQGLLTHRALVPAIFSQQFILHTPFAQDDKPQVQAITEERHSNSRELNLNGADPNLNHGEENEVQEVTGSNLEVRQHMDHVSSIFMEAIHQDSSSSQASSSSSQVSSWKSESSSQNSSSNNDSENNNSLDYRDNIPKNFQNAYSSTRSKSYSDLLNVNSNIELMHRDLETASDSTHHDQKTDSAHPDPIEKNLQTATRLFISGDEAEFLRNDRAAKPELEDWISMFDNEFERRCIDDVTEEEKVIVEPVPENLFDHSETFPSARSMPVFSPDFSRLNDERFTL